jgi:hypothetical protein
VVALCKLQWCRSPATDLHPACCVLGCNSAPSVKPCLSSLERLLPGVLPRTVHVQYKVEREYTIYTPFGLKITNTRLTKGYVFVFLFELEKRHILCFKITNTRLTKGYVFMFLFELERRHILCLYAAVRKGFCCRDSWCSDTDVELYSGGTVVEPGPR